MKDVDLDVEALVNDLTRPFYVWRMARAQRGTARGTQARLDKAAGEIREVVLRHVPVSAVSTGVRSKPVVELTKLELWERGRALLGYGEWTPDHEKPYPMYAGMEAHKLFLVMRKRRISNEEFLLCCAYCQRHHKRIENAVWVFRFIAEAKAEQREELAQQATSDLGRSISEALRRELALSDDMSAEWVGRLTRARGPYREEVLSEWNKQRNNS